MSNTKKCAICYELLENQDKSTIATLHDKGSASINQASQERGDNIHTSPGQQVHKACRRDYCKPDNIAKVLRQQQELPSAHSCKRRSEEQSFDFQSDCLYCGQAIKCDSKRKSSNVSKVLTIEFKDNLLSKCDKRHDNWAEIVRARVLNVHDLPAADAQYHRECSVNFNTNKQVPKGHKVTAVPAAKKQRCGRPKDQDRSKAFLETMEYFIRNDEEQLTVSDLINIMRGFLLYPEHEPYGHTHMKAKVQEHFGDEVIITEINKKANVVTLRTTAQAILQEFHSKQKSDPSQEQLNIIKAAAKLIKADIKTTVTPHETYPAYQEMESEESCLAFLPESLRMFLQEILVGSQRQLKTSSIGQAIMQGARPRVIICPLQIGLGVQLHHHFASRFLIDTLHNLGFCSPYSEIQSFQQNASISHGTDVPGFTSTEFIQYSADNVDHNICTLDGHGTFHGMRMIASVTPATRFKQVIPRVKVNAKDIALVGSVPIKYHNNDSQGMAAATYQKLHEFKAQDPTANLNIL